MYVWLNKDRAAAGSPSRLVRHLLPFKRAQVGGHRPTYVIGLETLVSIEALTARVPDSFQHGFVWGSAPAVVSLNSMVEQFAGTRIPVMLVGESGTGKEIYALVIHSLSGAGGGKLKKIACAAIGPDQLSKILREIRDGRGEEKVQTVFLDEIEELSLECQKQLLTWVPNGEFLSIRGTAHARIVSATTHDLNHEVAEGRFRKELYFRLNGACLHLPPLRERIEDIPVLLEHFLDRHAEELKKSAPALNKEILDKLRAYSWPGNIRELENVARTMVALGNANMAVSDLRMIEATSTLSRVTQSVFSLKTAAKAALRQTERELILKALERTKWNRKRAARELQISYKSLLYKLKQIEGIEQPK